MKNKRLQNYSEVFSLNYSVVDEFSTDELSTLFSFNDKFSKEFVIIYFPSPTLINLRETLSPTFVNAASLELSVDTENILSFNDKFSKEFVIIYFPSPTLINLRETLSPTFVNAASLELSVDTENILSNPLILISYILEPSFSTNPILSTSPSKTSSLFEY